MWGVAVWINVHHALDAVAVVIMVAGAISVSRRKTIIIYNTTRSPNRKSEVFVNRGSGRRLSRRPQNKPTPRANTPVDHPFVHLNSCGDTQLKPQAKTHKMECEKQEKAKEKKRGLSGGLKSTQNSVTCLSVCVAN